MLKLHLTRATHDNGLFSALEAEWAAQLRAYEIEYGEYDSPHMDHARKIVAENPPDRRYGIFVLRDDDAEPGAEFKGMVHINHAFPGTVHATLRMVWILLAPHFDFSDVDPDEIGEVAAGFLYGAVDLCQTEMKAGALKMHLGNMVDRQFALGLALGLRHRAGSLNAAVRGNWLHLDNLFEGR